MERETKMVGGNVGVLRNGYYLVSKGRFMANLQLGYSKDGMPLIPGGYGIDVLGAIDANDCLEVLKVPSRIRACSNTMLIGDLETYQSTANCQRTVFMIDFTGQRGEYLLVVSEWINYKDGKDDLIHDYNDFLQWGDQLKAKIDKRHRPGVKFLVCVPLREELFKKSEINRVREIFYQKMSRFLRRWQIVNPEVLERDLCKYVKPDERESLLEDYRKFCTRIERMHGSFSYNETERKVKLMLTTFKDGDYQAEFDVGSIVDLAKFIRIVRQAWADFHTAKDEVNQALIDERKWLEENVEVDHD